MKALLHACLLVGLLVTDSAPVRAGKNTTPEPALAGAASNTHTSGPSSAAEAQGPHPRAVCPKPCTAGPEERRRLCKHYAPPLHIQVTPGPMRKGARMIDVREGSEISVTVELNRLVAPHWNEHCTKPRTKYVLSLAESPPESTWNRRTKTLSWRPKGEHVGAHPLTFVLNNGVNRVRHEYFFNVSANRPPTIYASALLTAERQSEIALVYDREQDDLTLISAQGLPAGATLKANREKVFLEWTPTTAQTGRHPIVLVVGDGLSVRALAIELVVVPRFTHDGWYRWLLPQAGLFTALGASKKKLALGVSFGITILAGHSYPSFGQACMSGVSRRTCWPSHHRVYTRFGVAYELSQESRLYDYTLGYASSFEYLPLRRSFIPTWAIEVGGILSPGAVHRVQTLPKLGLLLWSDGSLWLSATLGYRLVPSQLREQGRVILGLSAAAAPW